MLNKLEEFLLPYRTITSITILIIFVTIAAGIKNVHIEPVELGLLICLRKGAAQKAWPLLYRN